MSTPSEILFSRRLFMSRGMQLLSLAGSLPLFLDTGARALAEDYAANPSGAGRPDDHVLVVVQLAGGNDGLNTVVPLGNDDYYKARPRLGVSKTDALKLTDAWGLHPSAKGFKKLFDQGDLSIVHAVGYPNANRSHFRATDIWTTAEPERLGTTGWLGRYCDASCNGADPGQAQKQPDPGLAVAFDSEPPPALQGSKYVPLTFGGAARYNGPGGGRPMRGEMAGMQGDTAGKMNDDLAALSKIAHPDAADRAEQFIERTALNARVYADRIRRATASTANKGVYPQTPLAGNLKTIAQLIASGMPTRIYYVKLGGFDTHANQAQSHPGLLDQLSGGIAAFIDDLKLLGQLDRVTLMTFSEFGRRVKENGSGTDHGEAAPLFLAGGRIKPGFHGAFPSLAPEKLNRGDVPFTTDFRTVYASLLRNWLGADDTKILGRKFDALDVLKTG
ncbi:MAG TPA: DUF1501 domain-containing protein [Tepidisphaeraceae bacterium]|nr:DUF1501 domain-containing protein [Tepidisphaeraceae bacterium]